MATLRSVARPTSAAPPHHLLTLDELGPRGLRSLLDLTGRLKRDPDAFRNRLTSRRIGMIFDKPSTRTRVSFESAIGPKVTAVAAFVRRTGRFAAIGALEDAVAVLEGRAGTRLVNESLGAA